MAYFSTSKEIRQKSPKGRKSVHKLAKPGTQHFPPVRETGMARNWLYSKAAAVFFNARRERKGKLENKHIDRQ